MATLADFRIFADLSSKDLEEFGGLIKRIRYRSEEIIFQEGAPAFGFYLIFSGRVKLVKRTLGGKKQILKILGPGEAVGETTLFDKGVHIAYAKTLEDSEVGFIERGDFFDFLTRHIPMIFRVFERFATEVKALQCKLTERSYNGSKERLARLILAVGEIGVELSRTELAEIAGVSSKTAIRTLGELEERGFIAVDERKVTILDRKSLGSLAEPFPITLDENLII